jgi:hypothetical protein
MQKSSVSDTIVALRMLKNSHSPAPRYTMLLRINVLTAILTSRLDLSRALDLSGSLSANGGVGKRLSLSRLSESCCATRVCLCLR